MTREKLVVTGANGFVGRHLVDYLLQQELHLTLIAREARSLSVGWRGNDRITVVETGALETASNLDKALEGATTVLLLAGLAHVRSSPASAQLFEMSNAVATKHLADAAAQAGVRSFVHLSSMATILGGAASDRIVDDATDEQPYSEYGRTKRMAEEHVSRMPKAIGNQSSGWRRPGCRCLSQACAIGGASSISALWSVRFIIWQPGNGRFPNLETIASRAGVA